MKNVVWVSHSGDLAGAEASLCEAAWGLHRAGIAVHVVVPTSGLLAERLAARHISTWVCPYTRWGGANHSWLKTLRRTCSHLRVATHTLPVLLKKLSPDLVISNSLTVCVGAVAASRLRIPHIWFLRELMSPEHGLRFDYGWDRSLRIVDRLSAKIIVNSSTTRDYFGRWLPREKLRIVYPAVEALLPPSPTPEIKDPLRLIQVAAKVPGKGQCDAIHAVAILRDLGKTARLQLVGPESPPQIGLLQSLVAKLKIADLVEFVPHVSNPGHLLADAHIALNCSRDEALGRTTIEAMKLGRVVVGADSGATRELIRDGETGLIYPPGNASVLAEKICLLWENPSRLHTLATSGQMWANDNFSYARQTAALIKIFREVISFSE